MKLGSLLTLLGEELLAVTGDRDRAAALEISGVTNDSRRVAPGMLFAAIAGAKTDGGRFAEQAVQSGAAAVLHAADHPVKLPPGGVVLTVRNAYRAYAIAAEWIHGFPVRKLRAFGVTGTNGKTTSAMLLNHFLNAAGMPSGLISTVECRLGNGVPLPADRTTPEAMTLQTHFRTMADSGLQAMVMEVSSHALAQDRIGTLAFHGAIFTNLTGDHLDYHKTMEAYFEAKRTLFTDHLASDGTAVINADDPWGRKLAAELPPERVVTFGMHDPSAQWQIRDPVSDVHGCRFTLVRGNAAEPFALPLPGLYNVSNAAGAILAAHFAAGIPFAALRQAAAQPFTVPGRLEPFYPRSGALVLVDYAHTDDALANVLTTLRPLTAGKLTVVFGAGGDRDRTKRPRMGAVCARLADRLILTSDNPRSEDPAAILREIASGIPAGTAAETVLDRADAIARAMALARQGDVVLIAGKGHETTQEIAGIKYPFDDRAEVRKHL